MDRRDKTYFMIQIYDAETKGGCFTVKSGWYERGKFENGKIIPDGGGAIGEGYPTTELKFKLKVKGPKMVYSGDLKSKDDKCIPVYDNIPIANLLADTEIVLEATAVLGTGKEHMKFSPGLCYYRNMPLKFKSLEELKDDLGDMKEDTFIFFIESFGQLSCSEMFNAAMDVLDEKLTEFSKKVEKLK